METTGSFFDHGSVEAGLFRQTLNPKHFFLCRHVGAVDQHCRVHYPSLSAGWSAKTGPFEIEY